MLTEAQRGRIEVVLVSPRNPLNIGAVARAMANFGFGELTVVAPYEPHWREARSAVGAPDLLKNAQQKASLPDAVGDCTLVLGTGTLTHRKPAQPVMRLDEIGQMVIQELNRGGRVAVVLGPEKHGLTREDLSHCHALVEIPTDPRQPSMNLGQAAAVCLYELSARHSLVSAPDRVSEGAASNSTAKTELAKDARSNSMSLETLADLIEQVMVAANYSPKTMQTANRHDLRLMLRRLSLGAHDVRRLLGLFRRILNRIQPHRQ